MLVSACEIRQDAALGATRRRFFRSVAAIFGAAAVAETMLAQSSTGTSTGDVGVLNFALSLELLEANFYTQGLKQFSSVDFANGAFAANLGTTINGDVYAFLSLIRDHENNHVHQITNLITSMGGVPVAACNYFFTATSADQFIATAMTLENTGVSAYDGSVNLISSASVKTAAAQIATVEGRHAAYLNLLNGQSPFPAAFDSAQSQTQIQQAITPFVSSCPAT